ncbi:MAG: Endonuclease III [Chlamydiales bacterium]|nr:Endonuclease III [Chlamydiales bacterium]
MSRSERATIVKQILDEYFPNPPISLEHKDPYTLLIAVVLSAQSTDAGVNKVTPILFAQASTPAEMARLDVETIREIIKPCGLSPKKSKAIKTLSQILLEKHGGQVPQTFEELEALPGVGHKTASVVLSQAFQIPAFPVDTHIFRTARRWGLSTGKSVEAVEKDLKKLFKKEDWINLHLQMIYYARQFCPAKGHVVGECPICSRVY